MRWRRLSWLDEHGQVAPDALLRARAQRDANLAYWTERASARAGLLDAAHWTAHGPDNVGGRTRAILVDPADPNRILAGAVSGGIWLSLDAGATWAPVDDALPNLAICCLTRDPSNPHVLYAGTGEGFFNADAIGGTGIYKSTDNGDSWTLLPSTAGWDNVCRIAVSPTNSNLILAAKRYGGIQRSTNGGASWTNPKWAQGSFYVAFDPTNGNKAVAQIIDYDWNTSDWFHAALYSTNGGANWTVASGLSNVPGFGARIELAYAPSNPAIVYASVAIDGGVIYRSTDGGHSYTRRTTSGTSGVSWYANPLWVDPTNPEFLVTGGYNILKSVNGGTTLTQISDGYIMTVQPHVDIHTFTCEAGFDGVTNRRLYVGTDGGVWRTDNIYTASTGSGWMKRDQTYATTQFYGAAGDGPTGRLYGGTQDNGTLCLSAANSQANLAFGGDGGFCAIDPTAPNYCYGEYITLQIHRSTNGGASANYIYNGIADAGTNANFIAPFILDPNNSKRMLAGGASLWRSENVKAISPTWQAIRAPGSDRISAIAVAPGNSDIIWVGQNNGELHRTTNGTNASPSWVAVDNNAGANPLPDRYITRILVDPDNVQVVYVALGGFAENNLWQTLDGGANWYDVTGTGATGLPAAPIRGVARHPDRSDWLYVGTEVGIFESVDGGLSWSTTNRGPANVSVDELVFMHNSTKLLAATHGRGLYTVDLSPLLPGDLNCDGVVNFGDINPFVLRLTYPELWQTSFPGCPPLNGDIDGNGFADFGDINPFVNLLTSQD